MKNNKKGFVGIGIILAIIAVLVIGGGAYYFGKKSNTLPKVEDNNSQQENQNNVVNVPVVNTPTQNTTTTTTVTTSTATSCLSSTAPWVKVISPNGGETYNVGGQITVKWTSCNVFSSSNDIVVALHQNGDWQNVVFLSEATINDGSQIFTIPTATSGSYKIRVGSASANVQQDFSDNLFTINTKSKPSETENIVISNQNAEEFKLSCINRGGEYNKESIFYGIGPVTVPAFCGFNKSSDAKRLCYSEDTKDNKLNNDCNLCTYKAGCGLAAGDFGPEKCYCGSYSKIESLKN